MNEMNGLLCRLLSFGWVPAFALALVPGWAGPGFFSCMPWMLPSSQAVSWRPVKADLCYSWLRCHALCTTSLQFSVFRILQPEWSPRWRQQLTLFILFYFSSVSSLAWHMDLRAETGTPNDDRSSIYRMSFCISLTIDFCLRLRFYSSAESDLLDPYRFVKYILSSIFCQR